MEFRRKKKKKKVKKPFDDVGVGFLEFLGEGGGMATGGGFATTPLEKGVNTSTILAVRMTGKGGVGNSATGCNFSISQSTICTKKIKKFLIKKKKKN
jgi:hypothetical protein